MLAAGLGYIRRASSVRVLEPVGVPNWDTDVEQGCDREWWDDR